MIENEAIFLKRLNKRTNDEKVQFVLYVCDSPYDVPAILNHFKLRQCFFKSVLEKESLLLLVELIYENPDDIIVKIKNIISKLVNTIMKKIPDRIHITHMKKTKERYNASISTLATADDATWDGFFDALKLNSIV